VEAELAQPSLPVGAPEGARAEESLGAAVERHLASYFAGFSDGLPPAGLYHRILREIEYPLLTVALAAAPDGPVTLAVSTHLALACPNAEEQEITRAFYYGWYDQVVTGLPAIEQGMISAGGAPGHGVTLSTALDGDRAVRRRTGKLADA